jgi:hypothetical protein
MLNKMLLTSNPFYSRVFNIHLPSQSIRRRLVLRELIAKNNCGNNSSAVPCDYKTDEGVSASSITAVRPNPPEKHTLDKEILQIAWPMLLTLAADPVAGLVDTAYIGRLGKTAMSARH